MPLYLTPGDIALRIISAFVASALVGINRGERGRSAGLRTTILVSMAAAFAMLLCNAILNTTGKTGSYFTQMDTMRLPLGVLTGVGFLGAGAIMRKGQAVVGLTTAATLWFVTVMGFCFGAGLYLLGAIALGIALFVLAVLKHVETRLPTDRRGSLVLTVDESGPGEQRLKELIEQHGFRVKTSGVHAEGFPRTRRFTYEVMWRASGTASGHPVFVDELLRQPGISALEWVPLTLREFSEGEP